MDKRFLVFIALLILLSSSGIGITAAESSGGNSTDTNSISDGLTDDNSVSDDTSVDDNSINDTSIDDNSINGTSIDDTFIDNNSINDTSINDTSIDDTSINDTSIDDTSINDTSIDDTSIDDNSVNGVSTENNLTDESEPISPESQTNIQHIETTQVYINNEQNVNVNITNDNSVVNNINFDAKKTVGKTTVVVEDLKDKSRLIDKQPAGDIYKSFNIWIDNVGVNNIENAAVNFQVEKSWLKENNLDKSAIVLNIYNKGKWVEVPVTITGQDTKYVYFMAKVSGYSSFAITGKTVNQTIVATKPEQKVNNTSAEPVNEIIPLLNEIIRLLNKIIELLR